MAGSQTKLSGSTNRAKRPSKSTADMAPKRLKGDLPTEPGVPGNELARFLTAELERRQLSGKDFYEALRAHGFTKTSLGTIYFWLDGTSTPRLNDLAIIASALGYKDWLALTAAVAKYVK